MVDRAAVAWQTLTVARGADDRSSTPVDRAPPDPGSDLGLAADGPSRVGAGLWAYSTMLFPITGVRAASAARVSPDNTGVPTMSQTSTWW